MAIEPVTREERFLAAAGGQSVTPPTPITRKEQLLQGIIDAVKSGGATPDVIENAVNNYLDANPVKPGATTEQAAQIEQNKTDIADLQTEIDEKQPKGDYVKTVNGNKPDESGNVVVATGGNGSGENAALMEPAEDDIPCVYLYTGGVGMPFTKDEGERQIRMHYESRMKSADYYLTAKVQGSSSAANPSYKKRNWTFKFYTDATYEKKLKLTFRGWPAMNKFVLKAGWVIPGHLRNVGAAQIWGQIMKTRSDFDSLPEELRNSPNLGATDGFHVRVFIDGAYWGIYDWIVAKDQLFGQDKDNPNHSILNSEDNSSAVCAFAAANPNISGLWSEELQDSLTADTKASMERWIKFVASSSDEDFVANAEHYFDVQSVIDAICFDRIIMTVDNMSRNQIVFKYDTKWFMGKWDLDAILGLPPIASNAWFPYDTPYQEGYVAYRDYGIINKLYDRTEELFPERLAARYWDLRSGPLSENNLVRVFGKLSDRLRSIEGLLAEENASTTGDGQFTGMPNVDKDTIQQIREFVVNRCPYMDEVITNMVSTVPATGITLSASTLTFDSTEPQTLTATVEPSDSTDAVIWASSDNGIATVENGVVTPVANGNVAITATAGSVSAECAVTVAFPEIACTGVTLSAKTLEFNDAISKTLIATVEPTNTTDPVVWETAEPAVATVDGGVVTAVNNGVATITVRCGAHSDSCIVTVSGIEAIAYGVNVLADAQWNEGYYADSNGEFTPASGVACSEKMALQNCLYELTAPGASLIMLSTWDADGNYVTSTGTKNSPVRFVAAPGYKYAVRVNGISGDTCALRPVDNRDIAVPQFSIRLADLSWENLDGCLYAKNLTSLFDGYGVTQSNYTQVFKRANMPIWMTQQYSSTPPTTTAPQDFIMRISDGLSLHSTVKYALAEWETYLDDHNPVLTIN